MNKGKPKPGKRPAFPVDISCYDGDRSHLYGMELRDWLAGQSLPICAHQMFPDRIAKMAYEIADEMMVAREKGTK